MRNDLAALPCAPGQFSRVANPWEAAGALSALRAGIAPQIGPAAAADERAATARP